MYAPTRDGMKKFVKESLEGKVKVKLSEFSWFDSEYEKTLFEAEGENCGLEIEGWNWKNKQKELLYFILTSILIN